MRIVDCLCLGMLYIGSACTSSPPSPRALSKPAVYATLLHKDSVFYSSKTTYVEAYIINSSTDSHQLSREVIYSPILSLQIVKNNSQSPPIPSIPPSVPSNSKAVEWIQLAPQDSLLIHYNLSIFDPPLPQGKYAVQMKQLPSNKVNFEIR